MVSRLSRCGALVAALTAFTSSAQAQNTNVAEALYRDGQQLLAAGKTHEACTKFADSQKADAAIGTLVNLALCHEKEGKTASAWSEYSDAAAQAQRAGQRDREQFAREHAAVLEKQLHRLVLEMKVPVKGMEIKLDGAAFGEGALGTPIPLDPGEHLIEVSAPGKIKWSQTAKLSAVASVIDRVEVPALVDDPNANAPPPVTGAPAAGGHFVPPPDTGVRHSSGITTTRLIGFFVTGLGAAAFIPGAIMFSNAQKLNEYGTETNPPADHANQTVDIEHAKTAQTGWIISFSAGGAAVITGVILIIAGRNQPDAVQGKVRILPQIGAGTVGLAGTF